MDQPKGIDVVKEAICKLKFNQQLKKSEGTKTPKVELTISIDGVAIQEPKTKTTPKVGVDTLLGVITSAVLNVIENCRLN